jgi:hypothetical protein
VGTGAQAQAWAGNVDPSPPPPLPTTCTRIPPLADVVAYGFPLSLQAPVTSQEVSRQRQSALLTKPATHQPEQGPVKVQARLARVGIGAYIASPARELPFGWDSAGSIPPPCPLAVPATRGSGRTPRRPDYGATRPTWARLGPSGRGGSAMGRDGVAYGASTRGCLKPLWGRENTLEACAGGHSEGGGSLWMEG